MDTLAAILSLVTPGAYMASIDLKHAYYTIPIADEQRKFLKFVWNEQLYEFCVLPMGLTSSPRIFTKVMKPVLATLRQKGHINSGFIDDFYFQGQEFSDCAVNVSDSVRLFISLGLHVHPDKCVLIPSQELLILGFLINSLLMIVKLPLEKKVKLRDLCLQALRGNKLTIQFVASVIGTLISALPGVEFGRLHYRNLERDKINALARNNGNYRSFMHLSEAAKQELQWWTTHVMHSSRRLRHPVISYIFQTDASDLGWGVTCTTIPQLQSQGLWTSEQRTLHINVRELGEAPNSLSFPKGAFERKPPANKHHAIWDVQTVLAYLKTFTPNSGLSLKELSHKLTMLLALVTIQRKQTLIHLNINNGCMIQSDVQFVFVLDKHIKQSRPNYSVPPVIVPRYNLDSDVFPYLCLEAYLEKTKHLRQSVNLLVATIKPHRAIGSQILARWIKIVLAGWY
ncbi:Hypothetical predicted protein [Paramuricea clavata]|uniref:Uncharacterized protein n=1 Tax=Paramuricea clavata TaxID=317549 RepID=A0A7D9II71_PARCT|nr:Hypothetical predicted protein [Paramuricea clavata]